MLKEKIGRLINAAKRRGKAMIRTQPKNANADKYYGEIARGYDQKRKQQPGYLGEQRAFQDALKSIPSGAKVLDVPFGTGRFADFYCEKNMTVVGADISADMLTIGKRTAQDAGIDPTLLLADAKQLPFLDDAFDLVVCCRLFHHLTAGEATKVLLELQRVTRGNLLLHMRVFREDVEMNTKTPYVLGSASKTQNKKIGKRIKDNDFVKWVTQHGFTLVQRHHCHYETRDERVFYLFTAIKAQPILQEF